MPTSNGFPHAAFPRSARLLTASDYAAVFKKSRRYGDRYWGVLVHQQAPLESEGRAPARLGLAIAKKRARRAVDRNRLKRIARETFRQRRAGLPSVALVVMNRDAATGADNNTLRCSLARILDDIADKASQSRG